MRSMTIREYLSKIQDLNSQIRQRQLQIRQYRELATSVGSGQYGERVQSSRTGDRVSHYSVEIASLQEEQRTLEDEIIEWNRKIAGLINLLPDPREREILNETFLCLRRRSHSEIANALDIPKSTEYELFQRAMQHIDEISRKM